MSMKGKIPWNKGKKLDRKKYPNMGHFKKHSKKSKEKMSESIKQTYRLGRIAWIKGKKVPELSRENNGNWNGGRTKTVSGYIWILCPEHPCANHGYVWEHRLVIEKILKRFLDTNETVHHINGIKSDNRIKNLMVFSSNSVHMRYHKSSKSVEQKEIVFDGRNYSKTQSSRLPPS